MAWWEGAEGEPVVKKISLSVLSSEELFDLIERNLKTEEEAREFFELKTRIMAEATAVSNKIVREGLKKRYCIVGL